MPVLVVVDGNNLLHAMEKYAPIPAVGRETLVKILAEWAKRHSDDVTLVFDGPAPMGGIERQMTARRVFVRFSAPVTADEIIQKIVQGARHPDQVRVVSSDKSVRDVAVRRRCRHTDSKSFVGELFAAPPRAVPASDAPAEKPANLSAADVDEWLKWFDQDEPKEPQ